jgi:hypothetical protein
MRSATRLALSATRSATSSVAGKHFLLKTVVSVAVAPAWRHGLFSLEIVMQFKEVSMNSKRNLLVVGSFGALLFAAQRNDVAVISGTVVDAGSLKPAAGVEVSWKSQKVTSDGNGRYEIRVDPGVREVFFSAAGRLLAGKVVFAREPASQIRQDVLIPEAGGPGPKVLALDRGSRVARRGKELESDIPADSSLSLVDDLGNGDRLLNLGTNARAHSPVWLDGKRIAFAKEGVLHDRVNAKALGVFQLDIDSGKLQQLASGIAAQFVSKSPKSASLAIATQKEVYVSDRAAPRRIFSLPANKGFLLSVLWGSDDRIYFTVDESVPVDNRRSLTRSRIASIKPDGTDLVDWAADAQYSYRYPVNATGGELLFGRFALDGTQQSLWSRGVRTGPARLVAEPALRAVHLDSKAGRLYYIYRQDLHLRDLKSAGDWVIVNSVREADYLRPPE